MSILQFDIIIQVLLKHFAITYTSDLIEKGAFSPMKPFAILRQHVCSTMSLYITISCTTYRWLFGNLNHLSQLSPCHWKLHSQISTQTCCVHCCKSIPRKTRGKLYQYIICEGNHKCIFSTDNFV